MIVLFFLAFAHDARLMERAFYISVGEMPVDFVGLLPSGRVFFSFGACVSCLFVFHHAFVVARVGVLFPFIYCVEVVV